MHRILTMPKRKNHYQLPSLMENLWANATRDIARPHRTDCTIFQTQMRVFYDDLRADRFQYALQRAMAMLVFPKALKNPFAAPSGRVILRKKMQQEDPVVLWHC